MRPRRGRRKSLPTESLRLAFINAIVYPRSKNSPRVTPGTRGVPADPYDDDSWVDAYPAMIDDTRRMRAYLRTSRKIPHVATPDDIVLSPFVYAAAAIRQSLSPGSVPRGRDLCIAARNDLLEFWTKKSLLVDDADMVATRRLVELDAINAHLNGSMSKSDLQLENEKLDSLYPIYRPDDDQSAGRDNFAYAAEVLNAWLHADASWRARLGRCRNCGKEMYAGNSDPTARARCRFVS